MKNASTGNTTPVNQTDWARVRAMTGEDIHYDADSPRTQPSDWEGAVLKQGGVEVGRVRGPGKRRRKEQVAIRFSPEVLAYFRATGKGWQTRMDAALREYIAQHPTD
ncbi:MAG: BrnA antitoxin family protein [Gammaproteobacteria bacterium]